jgi:HlyD family secretion protein
MKKTFVTPGSVFWYPLGLPRTVLLLLVTLRLGLSVFGCTPAREHREAARTTPIPVRVLLARRGEISDGLTVTGETAAAAVLRLASPVTGRVTWLAARPGDSLARNTVAARVLPLESEAALHGFRVLEDAAAMSPKERLVARPLQRRLRTADIPLRIPFAAVVATRLHNPGEQVAPTDVLLELFDPQSLYVLAQVPVESASRIDPGMPVEVTYGDVHVSGAVAALITVLEPQTLTLPVRVSLTTPLQPPLLHAAVECHVTTARHRDAVLVPRAALLSSALSGSGVLMIAADHRARRRTVQLGLHTRDEVEITDGLAAGEMVLADGQYSLPDGTLIQPASISE